jgi:hypothetical protein
LNARKNVRLPGLITVRPNTEVDLAGILVSLERLGDTYNTMVSFCVYSKSVYEPRMGSGGPAGTEDHVDTARSARQLLWAFLTVADSIFIQRRWGESTRNVVDLSLETRGLLDGDAMRVNTVGCSGLFGLEISPFLRSSRVGIGR